MLPSQKMPGRIAKPLLVCPTDNGFADHHVELNGSVGGVAVSNVIVDGRLRIIWISGTGPARLSVPNRNGNRRPSRIAVCSSEVFSERQAYLPEGEILIRA
jgi:hypothetical protein